MARFLSIALTIGALAVATSLARGEDSNRRKFTAHEGQDRRIASFASVKRDCTPGQLPTVKLKQAPQNGQVVVRQGRVQATNLKDCLAVEVPAYLVFYKSRSGFEGEDIVILEVIGANGRVEVHEISINVGSASRDRRPAQAT